MTDAQLRRFLTDRLTDDLARVWDRPGAAALIEVIDDNLRTLARGQLPQRWELRVMLLGYAGHPDFDPTWSDVLLSVPAAPAPGGS